MTPARHQYRYYVTVLSAVRLSCKPSCRSGTAYVGATTLYLTLVGLRLGRAEIKIGKYFWVCLYYERTLIQ